MAIDLMGWDVGGAHLKAVALDGSGRVVGVRQAPCPLWRGLDRLRESLERLREELVPSPRCRHAVTMTGELVDLFPHREAGVLTLVAVLREFWPAGSVRVFAGLEGFVAAEAVTAAMVPAIASANWLASGLWAAEQVRDAVLVDVGSTTTDIIPISDGQVRCRGYTDRERMRYDELLYAGVVRTPVMTMAERAPLAGDWTQLMAEHFATAADVYRLTGELPEHADQHPAADGGAKTLAGSRVRLARMFGCDADTLTAGHWHQLARFLRDRQLGRLRDSFELQLSRLLWSEVPPLVGAGTGRFLVEELARIMSIEYLDFSLLFDLSRPPSGLAVGDCAPAAALAALALKETA